MRLAILPFALLAAVPAAAAVASPTVETVALFDATRAETPESIQFDHRGNLLLSLALTGELRQLAPDGSQTTLAFLPLRHDVVPCGNAFGIAIMGGIALDPQDNVYASVAPCDAGAIGIYKVPAGGGAPVRIAALPPTALPNGIAYRAGWLYVADTSLGVVWRVAADGSSTSVWTSDPLLAPLPDFFPGPNGLQIFRDEVYVAVSDRGHVVAFPIADDGSAGPGRVHTTGIGLDDFAFDVHGNLYGTTDPFNTVVRVAPDGSQEVVLTAADGLDGPTSCAFGVQGDNQWLYVANAAFPFFTQTFRPSVLRVDLGVPGQPR
jgi:sugar lactone lactonase YvrE